MPGCYIMLYDDNNFQVASARERERDRETERQRDRETGRQGDRERKRETETERERERERERKRERDSETERQRDGERDRKRQRETNKKTFSFSFRDTVPRLELYVSTQIVPYGLAKLVPIGYSIILLFTINI
jgi:hypothetical protein